MTVYRFGDCLLDSTRALLSVRGAEMHVEPQVFDLLRHLVENRDRVVSRDELVAVVWNGRCVSETTIGARIFAARHAVGDSGQVQAIIRTLPRRGFRFVAPVSVEPEAMPEPPRPQARRWRAVLHTLPRRRLAIVGLLLVAVGMAAVLAARLVPAPLSVASADRPVSPLRSTTAVAVLPFVGLGDTATGFMGEALAATLVNTFASDPVVTVVARRASAGRTRRATVNPRQTVDERAVDYVIEGSVARASDAIRVTIELVDGATNDVLWARRYHCAADEFFALERKIAVEVGRHLDLRIAYGEGDLPGGTDALDAWLEYLRGRNAYARFSDADNARARTHFDAALAADPDYAEVMVALAKTYLVELGLHPERRARILARIDELATGAAEIAPELPQLFELRAWLALATGHLDRAIAHAEAMAALYPAGAESNYLLGQMAFFGSDYDLAASALELARGANPKGRASYHSHLAFARVALGDLEDAVAIGETIVARWPHYAPGRAYLAIFYQLAGRPAAARSQAALLTRIAPEFTLEVVRERFLPMADRDLALRLIEAARRAGVSHS